MRSLAALAIVAALTVSSPPSAEAQYRRSKPVEAVPAQEKAPATPIAAPVAKPPVSKAGSQFAPVLIRCELVYNLKGWSLFVATSKGEGKVSCSNGTSAAVTLQSYGGGFTVGKSEIIGGKGRFSEVREIDELFGGYAKAEAHLGAGQSGRAAVVTKGEVSLTLSGTGTGVNVGVALGNFVITKKP